MRDLLADSLFDIIRLRFLSSTTEIMLGFGSPELKLLLTGFGFNSFDSSTVARKSSEQSPGVEPFEENGKGFPSIESGEEKKAAGTVDSMVEVVA